MSYDYEMLATQALDAEKGKADYFGVESSGPMIELSVVIPCLNEELTVGKRVQRAIEVLGQAGIKGELIVADNGSTDGSAEIAAGAGARVVRVTERGYGSALLGGIAAARGEFVLMADADESHDLTHIPRFLGELRAGRDLVMGNRFRGGIASGSMPFLHRYLGNPVLTGLGRLLFKSKCGDFHCGMRGFRKASFLRMDIRSTGMEFASEMVVKATLLRMNVSEVPTTQSPDGRDRPPHLRTWQDGWRHLRFLLMYSPRWLFLYPGSALVALGALGYGWLLPGPRVVGGVILDGRVLVYALAAILLGFQFLAFAIFTKVFAISEGLLPDDPRLTKAFRFITLETGLLVGTVLVALGFAGTVIAFSSWSREGSVSLSLDPVLRLALSSVFALTLGVQVICSSFFLSILGLRRRIAPKLAASSHDGL